MLSVEKPQNFPTTLADLLPRPRAISPTAFNVALILAGSAVVALSAQIEIRLPFTPVPITGQTFGVLLVGMALGWKRAAISMLAYLLEGAAGLPVFAGGAAGVAKFVSPSAGYLSSFPISAALAGFLAERGWDRTPGKSFVAMIVASTPTLIIGMVVLSLYVGGLHRAFDLGVLPFVIGDLVKAAVAAMVLPVTRSTVQRIK